MSQKLTKTKNCKKKDGLPQSKLCFSRNTLFSFLNKILIFNVSVLHREVACKSINKNKKMLTWQPCMISREHTVLLYCPRMQVLPCRYVKVTANPENMNHSTVLISTGMIHLQIQMLVCARSTVLVNCEAVGLYTK